MAVTNFTPLLGLALPTTGDLQGTWGTTVNTAITDLLDDAVAGTVTLSANADVTLTTTNGADNQARNAVILWTASNGATTRNITAPAQSKAYIVINAGTGSVVIRGAGPTAGVTVTSGYKALVAWNGSDFVRIASTLVNLTSEVTGILPIANGGTATATPGLVQGSNITITGTWPNQTITAAAPGTVTSVAATVPSIFSIAGSPITSSGTLAMTYSGTALPVVNGGTGQTTATAAFTGLAPNQGGNSGKFLTTDGTNASWAVIASSILQVTTATTATTLTNTPTLLQITPTSYGVTVTLPDATTCAVGGPLHCIDNRGAFPVRVCNTSGTLLGFVFAGVVSYISLDNNSTAAGVWAISSNELVGASALLLTTNITYIASCISLDSDREVIIGFNNSGSGYAVVYNKTTNTFGAVTLIRAANVAFSILGVLSATNQVLVVSCVSSAATFEAVTLSISGTTITVNTAATATLSANIIGFADGCGLIAVGSSFVTSYRHSTACEIRALSISGTTVTIGAASTLTGAAGGLIQALGSVVIAQSITTSTAIYFQPFTVSGSTLTLGTAASIAVTAAGVMNKLFATGSGRLISLHGTDGTILQGSVVTLTSTTVTLSNVTLFSTAGATISDAIVVSSSKVLVLNNQTTNNTNILIDTAGTASAGTAITLSFALGNTKAALFVSGTDVYVGGIQTYPGVHRVDCSGASPVLTSSTRAQTNNGNVALISASNAVLSRSASKVYGTNFAQIITSGTAGETSILTVNASGLSQRLSSYPQNSATFSAEWTPYRGKSDSERWCVDVSTVITKMECVA